MLGSVGVAEAFEPKTTSSGELIRWKRTGGLSVAIAAPEHEIPGGIDNAVVGMREAFEPWFDEIPMIDIEFTPIANADAAIGGKDERNTVVWYYEGWNERFDERALAMTVTTYSRKTGAIIDADIAINAQRYRWTAAGSEDCSGKFDLQNVMAHEVGHLVGLAHEDDIDEVTMFPTSASCEVKKRDLADDDINGVEFLYLDPALLEGPEPDAAGPVNPLAGCSASGDASTTWVGALLLLLASVPLSQRGRRRRRRSRVPLLAALLAAPFVVPTSAQASTLVHLPVEQMAREASVVVRGKVVASDSRWDRGLIVTDSVVAVSECWTEAPCPERIVVRQLGGEVGDVGMLVEGTAPLVRDDEVVLFARARPDGRFAPVGMAQGAFSIARQPGGALVLHRSLRDLALVTETGAKADRIERFSAQSLRKMVTAARRRK